MRIQNNIETERQLSRGNNYRKPVTQANLPATQTPANTADIVDITADAKAMAQEARNTMTEEVKNRALEKAQKALTEMESYYKSLFEQLENANNQSDAAAEEADKKIKCLQIAMRIMSGDNVPAEDQRYLAKYDQGLYMQAVSMRVKREDPKDYDRLSEEEESDTGADASGLSHTPISPSPAAASAESAPAESAEAPAEAEA